MKSIRRIGFVLFTALAFAACSDDEIQEKVQEGLPVTSLRMQISVPETGNATMSRASDEVETNVEKLALFFYKKSQPNEPPVVKEITALGNLNKTSETNYLYTVDINVTGLYSGEWYLYAVANYDKQFVSVTLDDLKTMTKAQIDDFCTGGSPDLDIVETAILMSGKYEKEASDGTLTLIEGENKLQGDPCLVLRRLISKTVFNFSNGEGVTFVPESYDLYNYSTSSTLMERTGWQGNKGTKPGTLEHKSNSGTLLNRTNIPIDDKNVDGNYTFSFYTQENVQPDASECDSQADREKYSDNDNRDAHPRTNFKYAPGGATYVVVKGRYDGPGKDRLGNVTGNVEYTIHLGDFSGSGSYGNFTVRRNVKYTYNVKVTGVDNIIVEATSENGESQPGAEGDIIRKDDALNVRVDAHYEQILFALDINADLEGFALSLKTPYTNKTISSVDGFANGDDYEWVEFGKPQSTEKFNSYSSLYKSGKLCNIKDLLTKLRDIKNSDNQEYFLVKNNKVYVAAYVNEYFYENKDITDFVNAADREMLLSSGTSISQDGHSSYTTTPIFSIQQRSIKSPMKLSLTNPFGVETVEEDGNQVYINSGKSDTQSGTDNSNGYANTSALFKDNNQWSNYIDESQNGYIKGVKHTGMKPEYDYALYRVLSRNRDLNGDGTIDANEIRWYLPAHRQCMVLWYGNNSLPTETRFNVSGRTYRTYLTSSNNQNNRVWYPDEGVSFGAWKNGTSFESENHCAIRAIRSLKVLDDATSAISSYDEYTRTVTISGLLDECLRLSGQTGNYAAHGTGAEADKLPKAFKIAKNEISGTTSQAAKDNTIGSTYYEDDDPNEGLWRVPNEKELGLMLEYCGNSLSVYTLARTVYDGSRYYYIQYDKKKFITTNAEGIKASDSYPILLVRDAASSSGENTGKSYDASYTNSGVGFGVE